MTRDQIRAVLWVRWRLTLNQWRRRGRLEMFFGVLFLIVGALTGIGSFLAGIIGGAMLLGGAEPRLVMWIWFGVTVGFLVFWSTGVLSELEREETFDLTRLLHLPMGLRGVFAVNFLASHFSFTLMMFIPAMLGLAIGGVMARGPVMLWLLVLAPAFVLAVTAWTYFQRGMMAAALVNPRRRRGLVVVLMLLGIGAVQVPGLYLMKRARDERARPKPADRAAAAQHQEARKKENEELVGQIIVAQAYVPLLWLPAGAHALAERRALPAIGFALGCLVFAAWSLQRSYRATVRFYRGETDAREPAGGPPVPATGPPDVGEKASPGMIAWRLPGLPDAVSAVAMATLRSNLRAAEVRLGFAGVLIVTLVFAGMGAMAPAPALAEVPLAFARTAVLVVAVGMSSTFLLNVFGLDRHGFRAMVLAPVPREHVLLGKNLAWIGFCAPAALVLTAVGCAILRLSLPAIGALLPQLLTVVILALIAGNVLSILSPWRIASGSLKANKQSTTAALIQLGGLLLFPLVLSLVFLAPGADWVWREGGGRATGWPGVVVSLLLLGAVLLGYGKSLRPLGRWLRRREQRILDVVTAEVE